jgi:hypothetical protein
MQFNIRSALIDSLGFEELPFIVNTAYTNAGGYQKRRMVLQEAAGRGEVPAWQPAILQDRIRMFEGRLQLYGTQLEPDHDGRLRPYPIENAGHVEERRRAVGLEPWLERLAHAERVPLPADGHDSSASTKHGCAAWLKTVTLCHNCRRTRRCT